MLNKNRTKLTLVYSYLLTIIFFMILSPARAVDFSGPIGIESRYFSENEGSEFSTFIIPKLQWQTDSSSFSIELFARKDSEDDERTHADVREATWLYVSDNWEIKLGAGKIFWGVAETQHLVDVINQTDSVEFIDGEQKLGQPMIQLSFIRDWGNLDFFVLPYFRERTLASSDARLSGGLDINTDQAFYESGAEEKHIDTAFRYSHVIGEWDFGLSYFKGTNREPIISLVNATNGQPINPALLPATMGQMTVQELSTFLKLSSINLAPFYEQMEQVGLDVQATYGSWLWKLEAIHRETDSQRFAATTFGFEYTFYGIFETAADSGWLMEFSRDSRGLASSFLESSSSAQKDLAIAHRLTLNDVGSTEILSGINLDLDDEDTYSAFLEASTRFGNNWKVTMDAWAFTSERQTDIFYLLRNEDFIQLAIEYYF